VYVLQAVVDNPVALAALREVWSYPAAPGTVDLTEDDGQVRGVVASPDGAPLARFALTGIEGAEAERLVIDGELTARVPARFSTGDAEPVRLIQVNRAFALRDPTRAKFSIEFASAGERYPWGAVPVTNLIIAVDTRADIEYAPTEHVLDYFPQT
jgi:acetoacetate decarboxylase